MTYEQCDWWCQTGTGFPSTPEPGCDFGCYGMHWRCPCGRSWQYRRDHHWHQESRLHNWIVTGGHRHWATLHPDWLSNLRMQIDRWLADRRYPERRQPPTP